MRWLWSGHPLLGSTFDVLMCAMAGVASLALILAIAYLVLVYLANRNEATMRRLELAARAREDQERRKS